MKPFLKWAGGKGKLLDQLTPLLPADVKDRRYIEPFVGGGALFFHLQPPRAFLIDANAELITVYLAVQHRLEELIEELAPLAAAHTEAAYYEKRDLYNDEAMSLCERAALFIYLNRTCFNGLYRVNRNGDFNVPAGNYKNPRIVDPKGLQEAAVALTDTTLHHGDYTHVLAIASSGDFIYFDPPYAPLSDTSNFVAYTAAGFGPERQHELHGVFEKLHRRGCLVLLSNSDTPELRALYKGCNIREIQAPRAINASGTGRGRVSELAVTNY